MHLEINMFLLIVVPALFMGLWLHLFLRIAFPLAVLLSLGIDAATSFFMMYVSDPSTHPDAGSLQYYLHERLNKNDGPLAAFAK